MRDVKLTSTRAELILIGKVHDRAVALGILEPGDRLGLLMDLSAAHSNGCPLEFEKLLALDDGSFAHDVGELTKA